MEIRLVRLLLPHDVVVLFQVFLHLLFHLFPRRDVFGIRVLLLFAWVVFEVNVDVVGLGDGGRARFECALVGYESFFLALIVISNTLGTVILLLLFLILGLDLDAEPITVIIVPPAVARSSPLLLHSLLAAFNSAFWNIFAITVITVIIVI